MHPCQSPTPAVKPSSSNHRASSVPSQAETVKNGVAPRGKGKEREWVQEVERARNGDPDGETDVGREDERWFEWETMDNVYAGHCNEQCRVLCTVELGLAFSRRLPEEEHDEETIDGDGMVVNGHGHMAHPISRQVSSNASRPVSMGGVGLGGMGRNLSMSSMGGETDGGSTMVRNLLLKPKVLLESVVDIL